MSAKFIAPSVQQKLAFSRHQIKRNPFILHLFHLYKKNYFSCGQGVDPPPVMSQQIAFFIGAFPNGNYKKSNCVFCDVRKKSQMVYFERKTYAWLRRNNIQIQ